MFETSHEIAERLKEIRDEIITLLDKAQMLVRGTDEAERAEVYWVHHIRGAVAGRTVIVGMDETIEPLSRAGE